MRLAGSASALLGGAEAPPALKPQERALAEFLTPKELAVFINRPERTIERWRLTGDGPKFHRMGRLVRYRKSDAEAWLAARTFRSRADELACAARAE